MPAFLKLLSRRRSSVAIACALFAPWALLNLGGCSRPPDTANKGALPAVETRDDSFKLALEMFHEAKELPQFREALTQVSGPLLKQAADTMTPLDDKTRQIVKDMFRLDAKELDEIDAGTMRPLDAPYLESCYLFRDAGRALEIAGLAPRDQAAFGFSWAMKRVLLHEQHEDNVPPHLVLQRGYGGVRDRALVALELMRQGRLDGCIVNLPNKDGTAALLVGILLPKKDGFDVALFDPRLGLPIPGPKGQKITTLDDVRTQP